MSYIVAWNTDINAQDAKGLTALHLAVKSSEDIRSTKGVKLLLIKGADRNIKDNQGKKPIDLIEQFIDNPKNRGLENELAKLLVKLSYIYILGRQDNLASRLLNAQNSFQKAIKILQKPRLLLFNNDSFIPIDLSVPLPYY